MIARFHHPRLHTFGKITGMTAIFSGEELRRVRDYVCTGRRTAFIDRLFRLGIFDGDARQSLADAFSAGDIYAPHSLHVDITTRCPLACPCCYKTPGQEIFDLPPDRWNALIAEAGKLRVFQIAIGGGEPLTHPHLADFVRTVAATPMAVTLTSSGYGLDRGLLDRLIAAGLNHLQISLNGSTEAVNRLSRDGYHHAIRALELLSATASLPSAGSPLSAGPLPTANGSFPTAVRSLSFGINWVARRDNLDDFEALVALAKRYGANNVNILRYKPSPTETYADHSSGRDDFFRLARKITAVRGIRIKTDSAYSNLLLHLSGGQMSDNTCGCGAGRTFMAIAADGKMKPCSHLRMGSRAESLATYWNHSADVQRMRNFPYTDAPGSCGSCIFVDRCGGCRAVYERMYPDPAQGETDCPVYTPKNNAL